MNKRTFNEDSLEGILSAETMIDFEKFKFDFYDGYYKLGKEFKNLRNEHDEKVEIAQKQTRLAALCLLEKEIKKTDKGYDRFLDECGDDENKKEAKRHLLCEKCDVAENMRALFKKCTDFPKPEWFKGALAIEELESRSEMIDWCQKWMKSEPFDADPWYFIGVAYGQLMRNNDAILAFRRALRLNPEDAKVWRNLGITYLNINNLNDAIEAFRQALSIKPEDAEVWLGIGEAYYMSGKHSEATDAIQKLRHINPELADKLFNKTNRDDGLKKAE